MELTEFSSSRKVMKADVFHGRTFMKVNAEKRRRRLSDACNSPGNLEFAKTKQMETFPKVEWR